MNFDHPASVTATKGRHERYRPLPEMTATALDALTLPAWLPGKVRCYIDHVEAGVPLRELARRQGCSASTLLRQVRRLESRRDDPLMDEGLAASHRLLLGRESSETSEGGPKMTATIRKNALLLDEDLVMREGLRVLRRLSEPFAVLAIATEMDKAVVLRELPEGRVLKTAVVERTLAQAFALKDWITPKKTGRITSYEISAGGRQALRRMLQAEERPGLAEAPAGFDPDNLSVGERRRMRYTTTESPIGVLARRRDKDGRSFLEAAELAAATRLREDFELAQMGPRVAQQWESFLTGGIDRGGHNGEALRGGGAGAARDRVALALRDLGPGLGDVALRVCCYQEGIETAEQNMGWAARSGKIVLRIALQRLARHYAETYGKGGPLIG